MTDLNRELMEALDRESKVSVDEVTALIEAGANPNATNEDGDTALYKAAFSNDNYFTPRHEWLKIRQEATNENPEVFIALIKAGADAKAFFREYDAKPLLWANHEIMLAVVKQAGRLLEHADDSLKSDREIVLAAVKQDGRVLEHADDSLKSDREIVLPAVKQSGEALQYADDSFKTDREIVLEAMKTNGYSLQSMDEIFKSDQEIVLAAIGHNFHACQYASDTLKADPEFVAAAMEVDRAVRDYVNKELLGEMQDFEVTWEVYYWDEEVRYTTTESFKSESVESLTDELDDGLEKGRYCPEASVTCHDGDFNVEYVLIHDSEGNEVYRCEGEMDPKDW